MTKIDRVHLEELIKGDFEKYGWTAEQREVFIKFKNERYATYSKPEKTIKKYLHLLNTVVELSKKPFSEMTRDDILEFLRIWQESGWSETTLHGRKCKLKAFFRWESKNKHDPRVEDVRTGKYVSPITIDDLLTETEIEKLRETAKDNPRDLAMLDFHLLWGPRPSESARINIGHIRISKNYIVVNIPQTKTTARPVPIPLAKSSVIQDPDFLDFALRAYMSMRKWLNIHPYFPDSPGKPLWISEKNRKERLTEKGVTAVFKRLGKAAGLKTSVTTYVLRRTAYNQFPGVDREKLCAGFGWKPGSSMPTQVYNKLRPQDVLGTLIKEDDEPERDIFTCPECKRENPKDMKFCAWCGAPLVELPASAVLDQFHTDREAQNELEELREKMAKIEKMLTNMARVSGFNELLQEAAKLPPE